MAYVIGTDITTFVLGSATPTAEQAAWATLCASAVQAAIDTRMINETVAVGSDAEDELKVSALRDASDLYKSKQAPYGIVSFGDGQEVARIGADALRASLPVIRRQHSTAGYGIG